MVVILNSLEKDKQAMKTESQEAKVQAETISKAKVYLFFKR